MGPLAQPRDIRLSREESTMDWIKGRSLAMAEGVNAAWVRFLGRLG
jgi:hypothetical protein